MSELTPDQCIKAYEKDVKTGGRDHRIDKIKLHWPYMYGSFGSSHKSAQDMLDLIKTLRANLDNAQFIEAFRENSDALILIWEKELNIKGENHEHRINLD